jgi:tripartite-type tricarboxylate transporter receptor subunit TctC
MSAIGITVLLCTWATAGIPAVLAQTGRYPERPIKAMTFPETIKRFEAEGIDVVGTSPEQAAATMESELKKYAVLIRERGMKAD